LFRPFTKGFNVNLILKGQVHGGSGSRIYPPIYFPYFRYSLSFVALCFVSMWTYIESLFYTINIVFHFPRLLQYARMLMGHSAAAVYTINVPTGSRKQRCLETQIFSYLFNVLLFNPLRFISFCWWWWGGNGLRDHFAAFTRLRNHNTGKWQNALTWLATITATIPALEVIKF
jgi:hypothetical protein